MVYCHGHTFPSVPQVSGPTRSTGPFDDDCLRPLAHQYIDRSSTEQTSIIYHLCQSKNIQGLGVNLLNINEKVHFSPHF